MTDTARIVRSLWDRVAEVQPTEHQQSIHRNLQPDENLRIRGELGVGKTFTVRNYLATRDIEYEYYTAREVAEMTDDEGSNQDLSSIRTIVVDNFDVIPARRSALDKVYRDVELHMESRDRGVWLIFPENHKNEWFESVIGTYTNIEMTKAGIDQFAVDRVRNNIDQVTGYDGDITVSQADIGEAGYHDMITSYANSMGAKA